MATADAGIGAAAEPAAEAPPPAAERPAAERPAVPPAAAPASPAGLPSPHTSSSEDQGAASSSSESDQDYAEVLSRFAEIVALRGDAAPPPPLPTPTLPSFDLAGVAALIASGAARRIVLMCGAGISVSAGIPDFRSPGTGLYSRLAEYKLPHPQAVFEIDFFRKNPQPFYLLAKELFPGNFVPTPTHHLIRLLHDKGLLLRCYTQNIDSLEVQAGVPPAAVIAAHGNFDSARCVECKAAHEVAVVRAAVMAQQPCRCGATPGCRGLVKPDIVFFGESLPARFWASVPQDFADADLLIVLGTSLVVHPFASLIDKVGPSTPRLLINRERVGEADESLRAMGYRKGFCFGEGNHRDALFEGDCDEGARQLAELLGWGRELDGLISAEMGKAGGVAGDGEEAGPAGAAGGSSLVSE